MRLRAAAEVVGVDTVGASAVAAIWPVALAAAAISAALAAALISEALAAALISAALAAALVSAALRRRSYRRPWRRRSYRPLWRRRSYRRPWPCPRCWHGFRSWRCGSALRRGPRPLRPSRAFPRSAVRAGPW